jgi:hypothetical protein
MGFKNIYIYETGCRVIPGSFNYETEEVTARPAYMKRLHMESLREHTPVQPTPYQPTPLQSTPHRYTPLQSIQSPIRPRRLNDEEQCNKQECEEDYSITGWINKCCQGLLFGKPKNIGGKTKKRRTKTRRNKTRRNKTRRNKTRRNNN